MEHSVNTFGTILFGDLNRHELPWLKYSRASTPEGRSLFQFCCKHGFTECVGEPTRGLYLLDLFLTDLDHAVSSHVHTGVSDHSMVFNTVSINIESAVAGDRACFSYNEANRTEINTAYLRFDWLGILTECHPDQMMRPDVSRKLFCSVVILQRSS